MTQLRELSYIHSRDVTFAVFAQGPYEESRRYRDFMGQAGRSDHLTTGRSA